VFNKWKKKGKKDKFRGRERTIDRDEFNKREVFEV